jgi:cytochrome c biogenesis protein CcdA
MENLERLLSDSPMLALCIVFWIGAVASLSLCTAIRLPIVLGYVAAVGNSRKRSLLLTALFLAGLVLGYVLIGTAAAFIGGTVRGLLRASQFVFWATGFVLILVGILASGVIGPGLLPQRLRRISAALDRASPMGALVLGALFGLLTMPACPLCGAGLIVLAGSVATLNLPLCGVPVFISFALGQGLPLVAVGVLTAIVKPNLIRRLRARLCSIEQQIQLLCGNLLIVLGIYFIVVG